MLKARIISLAILLLLIIYLGATALFAWFFRQADVVQITRTPAPTFTPISVVVATLLPTFTGHAYNPYGDANGNGNAYAKPSSNRDSATTPTYPYAGQAPAAA